MNLQGGAVRVNLAPELAERLDRARKPLGMTRSSFVKAVLGEKLPPAAPKADIAA